MNRSQTVFRLVVAASACTTLGLGAASAQAQTAFTQDPYATGAQGAVVNQTVQNVLTGGSTTPASGTAPTTNTGTTTGQGGQTPLGIPSNVQQTIQGVTQGNLSTLGLPNLGLPNLSLDNLLSGLGLGNLLGGLGDWLGNLGQSAEPLIKSATGALGIGDPKQAEIKVSSPNPSDEGVVLAEKLELGLPGEGTFNVRTDVTQKAERDTAIGVAKDSALSADAQKNLADRAKQAQAVTKQNLELGKDSEGKDVSQQIAQNQSKQLALLGQITGENLKESQQARVDRSLSNLINAQQARELNVSNTADRRKTLAAGATAGEQTGLLMLPGGFYLGSTSPAKP